MDAVSDLPQIARLKERFRALPPLQVDLALTAFVLLIQLWPFVGDNHDGKPWHWWGYVVVITAVLPLVWRRRAPVTSMAVSMLALSLYDLAETVPAQPIWYGSLISMYTVAAYTPRWPRLAVLAITIGGGLLLVGSSETAVRGTVGAVAAYAIGRATATSRAYAAALEERAVRLERERVLEAERAAELERARIARDMHDILAHAVSLMVVQAEAGPVVVRSDPGRAEAAFDAIAAAGRDAMVQLRRMLGALKEEEGPRAPQPTVADLSTLASQLPLPVSIETHGIERALPSDVEVAVYRIAQESFTNIVKHSGASRAELLLRWQPDALLLDITDDGEGSGLRLPSGGHGLIGIRERAAACGGTASAGPRADGPGFHVSVRLPLTPVEEPVAPAGPAPLGSSVGSTSPDPLKESR
ncbi:signal transduction histidine kinase [Nonomuraea dietziae]|uniref:histidine kinase n=1 Tax=Nonomuraea dietziae TaxID=65515 RepID=A0A7W5V3D6_9ACTN|nr:signal transduction histidine kinase [Nonomuraea dietziae]